MCWSGTAWEGVLNNIYLAGSCGRSSSMGLRLGPTYGVPCSLTRIVVIIAYLLAHYLIRALPAHLCSDID